jgi:hypothetical protein
MPKNVWTKLRVLDKNSALSIFQDACLSTTQGNIEGLSNAHYYIREEQRIGMKLMIIQKEATSCLNEYYMLLYLKQLKRPLVLDCLKVLAVWLTVSCRKG